MVRLIVAAVALLGLTAGMAGAQTDSTAKKPAAPTGTKPAGAPATGASHAHDAVVLETVQGEIVLKLADADAPKTCANFRKLVASKFYDGTCFHRVIPGFMIQGGDPNSKDENPDNDGLGGATGADGKQYTVPAEIKLQHQRGSLATARQGDGVNPAKASSSSQFFIDLAPQPSLDAGGYTVFGEVISGMETVDKIAALANDPSLPNAGGGGKNPMKKAMIKHAYFAPLSKYTKPATSAATTPTEGTVAPKSMAKAPADTTKH